MISPTGLPTALASLDRTLVMGILNVTPDSFSDGGRWAHADAAVDHAIRLHADGADLVDVGGESTRPGAVRISADEELSRVGPVVTELSRRGIPVSIDTMRADVAAECVAAGACLVNDVSGGMAVTVCWRQRLFPTSPCTGADRALSWTISPCTTTWLLM